MKPPKISRNICLVLVGMATLGWLVASRPSQIETLTVLGAVFVVTAVVIHLSSMKKKTAMKATDKAEESA